MLARVAPMLKDLVEEIAELDKQIQRLKDRRVVAALERDRIKRLMYEPPTFEQRNGSAQTLFVHTRYFLPYIQQWIEDYNALHGRGGLKILALRAAMSTKNIRSYNNGSITYAGIMSVDRLLTAIGREDLMENMPFKTTTELKLGAHKLPQPPPTQYYEE